MNSRESARTEGDREVRTKNAANSYYAPEGIREVRMKNAEDLAGSPPQGIRGVHVSGKHWTRACLERAVNGHAAPARDADES